MKRSVINTRASDTRFVALVLAHYEKSGRHDLIWRKNITPYKILVSEIMLQQTQVSRVVPKFMLWMKQYPTLAALSKATLTDVLLLWQGLGYQRRAKALYDIAQTTKALPKRYEELLSLQGIGPYTASAVCAFAYDAFPEYLLETNIRTALIEAFHQGETVIHDGMLYDDLARLTKNKKVLSVGARTWYYALMDYGAYLKASKISHNEKSAHYAKQTPYEGSTRQLRAKTLFAITHNTDLPDDDRLEGIISQLLKEGYIKKKGKGYTVV
jgi:A/G-specific adenine glycosylase